MFDYAKYENATQKEIIHALNLTQRKSEKLNQQLKENRQIFKFLQKRLKESFSSKKTKKEKRRPELDEAIRQYENGEVEHYSSVEEAFKALNAE